MIMLFLNIFVYLIAVVCGSLDELEADFGSYRDRPDRELKLDFYKRLASIDLQVLFKLTIKSNRHLVGTFEINVHFN